MKRARLNIDLNYLFVLIILLSFQQLRAQSDKKVLLGKVSYKTSSNIYVKFNDLRLIEVGDTLFISKHNELIPALIVDAKSSTTCVAHVLNNEELVIDQEVRYFSSSTESQKTKESVPTVAVAHVVDSNSLVQNIDKKEANNISGRVSISNYSNFSIDQDLQNHRQFVALSLKLKNIGNKRWWAETYGNYSLIHPSHPSENLNKQSLFRLFNLAIHNDFKKGGRLTIGRKYSSRLNSVGSIDGVQVEKTIGKFYVGGLAGFRPDVIDFSFNTNLFQYGAFVGYQSKKCEFSSNTTLGYVDQYNNSATDRRYIALQHNSFVGKLNFFISSELDLYNPTVDQLRLTNFYFSARYRLKKANFMVSYDSRKRVIYYQSYESLVGQYLLEDIKRDGIRFRLNYKFTSNISAGVSANYRLQSNHLNKSNSYFIFVNVRQLPVVGGDINLSYSLNYTDFLNSSIPSIRYSRDIVKNKIRLNIFYRLQGMRYVNYDLEAISNHFVGFGSSFRLSNKSLLNVFAEYSTMSTGRYLRINASITHRL